MGPKEPSQPKSDNKKYYFTKEEREGIIGRMNVYKYVQGVIEQDVQNFISGTVCQRLKLPIDFRYTISQDGQYIEEVKDGEPKDTTKEG